MKSMTITTIHNASRKQLLDFIAALDKDYPEHLSLAQIRDRVKECERKSYKWFGETITFEEWAN